MSISKQIKSFVQEIITDYAEYSRADECYLLDVKNIPDYELNKLAALIISQNDDIAAEAAGPDNPDWEKYMKPALFQTLANNNTCSAKEFSDMWRSGIRSYLMPKMTKMIDDALQDFNGENGCATKLVWNRVTEKTMELRI